jgi:hypothetical protein
MSLLRANSCETIIAHSSFAEKQKLKRRRPGLLKKILKILKNICRPFSCCTASADSSATPSEDNVVPAKPTTIQPKIQLISSYIMSTDEQIRFCFSQLEKTNEQIALFDALLSETTDAVKKLDLLTEKDMLFDDKRKIWWYILTLEPRYNSMTAHS